MRILLVARTLGIVAGAILSIAVLSGAAFERLSRDRAARQFAPAGRLVDVGGRRIQIDCRGTGSPTVVFESGLDIYGSLAWTTVHDSVARTARACAYSRAGIMWSDRASRPFDADSAASDLHASLVNSGESAPWVLVGHSLGGPYITAFTARYPEEVAGLVMVDASHPEQFAKYEKVVGRSIAPTPFVYRLGAALSWTGLVRLMPQPPEPPGWPRAMRGAPSALMALSIAGLAAEVSAAPVTLDRLRRPSLGDRPLIVLCAGNGASPDELAAMQLTAAQGVAVHKAREELCIDMATWSSRGRLQVVDGASHYIQIDRPGAVIGAVNEVVGYVIAHDSTPRRR